jgi:enolase
MIIEKIIGREIYDSRGYPTIECEIILEDGTYVLGSAPSGLSKGVGEAYELRDGGTRLMGLGVNDAVEKLEHIIAPELIGKVPDLVSMDVAMLELDGTDHKSNLGANTMIATSIAVLKAQAAVQGLELYEMIARLCGYESISLPVPMFNMINGGRHADNSLQIQEFLVIPTQTSSFRAAMEAAVVLYNDLKNLLKKNGKNIAVGDEGGFASDFKDEKEALDYLMQAIEMSKQKVSGGFVLGLDVAASQFYNVETNVYNWHKKAKSSEDMIEIYRDLIKSYPLYSIEDGLADRDWLGWQGLTEQLSENIQIIGDDIFVTDAQKIWQGIEQGVGTAAIIKPNQVGTLTEALQAIKLCKEYEMGVIVSHRSGETNDDFIAELAVGANAGHIKAGACCRGERIAKYNQLLRIEDDLVLAMLG